MMTNWTLNAAPCLEHLFRLKITGDLKSNTYIQYLVRKTYWKNYGFLLKLHKVLEISPMVYLKKNRSDQKWRAVAKPVIELDKPLFPHWQISDFGRLAYDELYSTLHHVSHKLKLSSLSFLTSPIAVFLWRMFRWTTYLGSFSSKRSTKSIYHHSFHILLYPSSPELLHRWTKSREDANWRLKKSSPRKKSLHLEFQSIQHRLLLLRPWNNFI